MSGRAPVESPRSRGFGDGGTRPKKKGNNNRKEEMPPENEARRRFPRHPRRESELVGLLRDKVRRR